MNVITVRNVNAAIDNLVRMMSSPSGWHPRDVRDQHTLEWHEPVVTEYVCPHERVSFSIARDANPFFHLFESLWILAGRSDVKFLSLFNSKISEYSDDGLEFHAPYGFRLRNHFADFRRSNDPEAVDQIAEVISLLRSDPETRRAVMAIWDPTQDLNVVSKDIPCNDTLFFKKRDRFLDLTVCCRSNDAIWGAYGANAVQFSVILEFVATAVGLSIGSYRQLSDSFHYYPDIDVAKRMAQKFDFNADPYRSGRVTWMPMIVDPDDWKRFLDECERFCDAVLNEAFIEHREYGAFFNSVVIPMWDAWHTYKGGSVASAVDVLESSSTEIDWIEAGIKWLVRRVR